MTVSGNGYQGVLATSELLLTQNKPLEKAVSQIERNLPRQSFEGCNDYDQVNRCPLCTSNMAKGRTFVPSKEKEGNWVSLRLLMTTKASNAIQVNPAEKSISA